MKRGTKGRAKAGGSKRHEAASGDKRDRLAMHRARCLVCRHPEREEIEREFLDWVSARETAERWKFADYRTIYRHAHAVGLFRQRRANRQMALDCIIERVREVKVTASAVVAAIRLSAKLEREGNDDGVREQAGRKFVLSLDGLPRTDAVTGHQECGGPAFAEAMAGRPAFARATADATRRERAAAVGDFAGGQSGEAAGGDPPSPKATADKGPHSQGAAGDPPSPKASADGRDPRVVFGEEGRVAGIPWPKGEIAFAPRVRWRPGRGGPEP